MQRGVDYLFRQLPARGGSVHRIACSFLELHNEQVYDLLASSGQGLPVRWSAGAQSFFVENLLVVECATRDDMLAVVEEGVRNRSTASHLMNNDSSRSHSLFTVHLSSRQGDLPLQGKLNFVDLAGSERIRDSGSAGQQAQESIHINKSLLVLGQVISVLAERQSTPSGGAHIPYRDSKLTKLLMDSLGGAARTAMIACVSPAHASVDETLNTLKYAQRTRNIRSMPARRVDPHTQTLRDLREEIEALRQENAALRHPQRRSSPRATPTPSDPSSQPPQGMARRGSVGSVNSSAASEGAAAAAAAADGDAEAALALLRVENARLRADNMRLRRLCHSCDGAAAAGAAQQQRPPALGELRLVDRRRPLQLPVQGPPRAQSGAGSADGAASDADSASAGAARVAPAPQRQAQDLAAALKESEAQVRHLRAALLRAAREAQESDPQRGATLRENLRLLDALRRAGVLSGVDPAAAVDSPRRDAVADLEQRLAEARSEAAASQRRAAEQEQELQRRGEALARLTQELEEDGDRSRGRRELRLARAQVAELRRLLAAAPITVTAAAAVPPAECPPSVSPPPTPPAGGPGGGGPPGRASPG
eukprot:TRINITY_DN9633_c3_g1_i1.p1 TRINITY_DN9633_c3_g1~~TRINITY_DN9633_c3_g1_i1.p1  ORF type:complete len:635 (+),score=190.68 TRINITY_DN9633_c3_g1_i1:121-1905(+)